MSIKQEYQNCLSVFRAKWRDSRIVSPLNSAYECLKADGYSDSVINKAQQTFKRGNRR